LRPAKRSARRTVTAGILAVLIVVIVAWGLLASAAGENSGVALQAVVTGLLVGGVYGLVAMGLALIFGVLGIINFAHGALMGLAMYGAYALAAQVGMDPYLAIVVTVPLLFLVGAAIQFFLVGRVLGGAAESQLLLTLGLAIVIENLLLAIFTATPRTISVPYIGKTLPDGLHLGTAVASTQLLIAFVGSILLGGLLYLLLHRTRLGTAIRAVAENPRGAVLVGVDVRRIYVLTFALGCACVGAAGTLMLPFVAVSPTIGDQFNIVAFVVVVLGGLGNVPGALAGGLIIGLIQYVGGAALPQVNSLLLVFAVFVLTLLFRPQGLFGRG
jgi:branched-chain amino acid transport system permease protein